MLRVEVALPLLHEPSVCETVELISLGPLAVVGSPTPQAAPSVLDEFVIVFYGLALTSPLFVPVEVSAEAS
mgnify:CR=1 FL=1